MRKRPRIGILAVKQNKQAVESAVQDNMRCCLMMCACTLVGRRKDVEEVFCVKEFCEKYVNICKIIFSALS